jgi:diguanylate cyclase (GGDEF)-like protein
MVAQAEAAAARGRHWVFIAASVTLAGIGLSVAGFIIVRWRVERPILALTDVIARLAEQDFSVELPPKIRDDEVGRMRAALLVLRANGRAYQAAVAEANRSLSDLANVDALTGLSNRRRLDEALSVEWLRAAREQQPVSMLMIDVDRFKEFNDHYGHQAGDACLRKVAAAVAAVARRPADIAARYGGEEFVLLLSNTEASGVVETARRLQARMSELAIEHAESPFGVVTLSIGLATAIPGPDNGWEALLADADRGVYRAKRAGRNRYCWGDAGALSPSSSELPPAVDRGVDHGEPVPKEAA